MANGSENGRTWVNNGCKWRENSSFLLPLLMTKPPYRSFFRLSYLLLSLCPCPAKMLVGNSVVQQKRLGESNDFILKKERKIVQTL